MRPLGCAFFFVEWGWPLAPLVLGLVGLLLTPLGALGVLQRSEPEPTRVAVRDITHGDDVD